MTSNELPPVLRFLQQKGGGAILQNEVNIRQQKNKVGDHQHAGDTTREPSSGSSSESELSPRAICKRDASAVPNVDADLKDDESHLKTDRKRYAPFQSSEDPLDVIVALLLAGMRKERKVLFVM